MRRAFRARGQIVVVVVVAVVVLQERPRETANERAAPREDVATSLLVTTSLPLLPTFASKNVIGYIHFILSRVVPDRMQLIW